MKRSAINRVKERKCAVVGCQVHFLQRTMRHIYCSAACAIVALDAKKLKAQKTAEKLDRAETKVRKEKLKTRSDWIADIQKHFNALIRFRDQGELCICCNLPFIENSFTARMEAGHFLAVSVAPQLRFDLRNCHGQRRSCNVAGETRRSAMRAGVVARIGAEAVAELESTTGPAKWTIEDLKKMKADFIAQLRELKK